MVAMAIYRPSCCRYQETIAEYEQTFEIAQQVTFLIGQFFKPQYYPSNRAKINSVHKKVNQNL
jgi:hypothetical protein